VHNELELGPELQLGGNGARRCVSLNVEHSVGRHVSHHQCVGILFLVQGSLVRCDGRPRATTEKLDLFVVQMFAGHQHETSNLKPRRLRITSWC
jgi:hypothetical protein